MTQKRIVRLVAVGLAGALFFNLSTAVWAQDGGSFEQPVPYVASTDRLIVKLRASSAPGKGPERLRTLTATAGVALTDIRGMSGDAHVLLLPERMMLAQAAEIAGRLSLQPDVEYAEPDQIMQALLVPSDSQYPSQWHYQEPSTEIAGANLPPAWDITTGTSSVVAAVIDTGLVPHADLDSNILDGAGRVAPGYDFISGETPSVFLVANDSNGRDNNPTDPGDWITVAESASGFFSGCPVTGSSWHGTHVAGTIGAASNNGLGVTGINWNSRILPVRVLGKCGGYTSDIVDGMRWAAGLSVPGVPANSTPAKVLNLSLGGNGACGSTYQSAVNDILAAGSVVIVAAGNENTDANNSRPANCVGVIAVAATTRSGGRASYSNFGSVVRISAPGGDGVLTDRILSTLNTGTTSPVTSPAGDAYAYYRGTSMSSAHVSGVASLMFSANPVLTPAKVLQKLQATARAFPGTSCNTFLCGAGIVDAAAAVRAVSTPPTASAGPDRRVNPGSAVNLNGTASSDDGTIVSYAWSQTAGPAVNLNNANTAESSFTAPNAPGATLAFQLTVTDDVGLARSDSVNVAINTPPAANAGPDQAVGFGAAVALNGTASTDTDGPIASYAWTQTAGPPVTLSGATTASAGFTAPGSAASLVFQLTVTDSEGLSASDTVAVTVQDIPAATGGKGGGCFIATAAWGTPMAREVRYLRAFRDEYLLTHPIGSHLVDLYYRASPPLAAILRQQATLRAAVRWGLAPWVALSRALVSEQDLQAQTADRP